MIHFKNVSFSYKDNKKKEKMRTQVFDNLSLEIPDNGITAVVAPSGVGKTTLLKLIAGLLSPDSGKIKTTAGEGMRVADVFQEQRLLPWYSAFENVKVVTKRPDGEIKDFLSKLGITDDLQKKRPSELSGGQRQRVCLSRALLFDSDILLLDEPFTGLDDKNREIVQQEIKEYARKKPVVLVSHVEEDLEIADKKIEL
ncbi:MAG: ATP-binding cassette domain-containing protein [Clostridia bacterium]|nr:ATP-binding cassette domain-containing protein [Clostridia bacterium]